MEFFRLKDSNKNIKCFLDKFQGIIHNYVKVTFWIDVVLSEILI